MAATSSIQKILASFPALKDYIARIGAREINFRRFVIEETDRNGYPYRIAEINVKANGEIEAAPANVAPTTQEREAIRAQVEANKAQWPTSVITTDAKVDDFIAANEFPSQDVYRIRTRKPKDKGADIVMLHVRRDGKKGKFYVPYTYFSDGEFYPMEPDNGLLPFWKPERSTSKFIMVHEGAKTAEYLTRMIHGETPEAVEWRKSHPWSGELAMYEHWGMIGGVNAVARVDFKELREHADETSVVYVCDNDPHGVDVLPKFSKRYGGSLKGFRLDKSWPPGWDLSDPIPKDKFNDNGKVQETYRSFERMLVPATWATDVVIGPNNKPMHVLSAAFKREWFFSVEPLAMVHISRPNFIYNIDMFNVHMRAFSDVELLNKIVHREFASRGDKLSYNPGKPSGFYVDGGVAYLNTHVGTHIKPEKGDAKPWHDYVKHLIPNDSEREHFLDWCATLIAAPHIRMGHGMLLASEMQGVGKGMLLNVLGPLVGNDNWTPVSEQQIVNDNFNGWVASKRLAFCHEIYSGQSTRAYNNLKDKITEHTITVNKKYQAEYTIQVWVHIIACSNSMRPLRTDKQDRRWFMPQVTEKKRTPQEWANFMHWLQHEDGLGIVRQWAIDRIKDRGPLPPNCEAPITKRKEEIWQETRTREERAILDALEIVNEKYGDDPVVMFDSTLTAIVKEKFFENRPNDRLERPGLARRVAVSQGWSASSHGRTQIKDVGRGVLLFNEAASKLAWHERRASDLLEDTSIRFKPLQSHDLRPLFPV